LQTLPGSILPSPNRLRRKILIKNKRLPPEKELVELELYVKGQLAIDDEEERVSKYLVTYQIWGFSEL
jgi:hypothetical protein